MKDFFGMGLLIFAAGAAGHFAANHPFYRGTAEGAAGHPIAGADVRVCRGGDFSVPCSRLAKVYETRNSPIPGKNPFKADKSGSFGFYAAPGYYTVQVSSRDLPGTLTFDVVIGGAKP